MIDIGHLPLFNQDYEEDGQTPDSYAQFRQQVAQQDGFVFVTPSTTIHPGGAQKRAGCGLAPVWRKPVGGQACCGHQRHAGAAGRLWRQPASAAGADVPRHAAGDAARGVLPGVHDMLDEQGAPTNPDIRALLQQLADALVAMLA